MKWFLYLILVVLLGGSWVMFEKSGKKLEAVQVLIDEQENLGDPEAKMADLKKEYTGLEGERLFTGILLTFFSAGVAGIVIVVYLLPFFAQRLTHSVYDSAELVEKDAMHDARSLMAQGEYEAAIEAYKQAAIADPMNRVPWVEIAKVYKDHLGNPGAAIDTIRQALESQSWEPNDAAFLLFRLAELYHDTMGDHASAVAIMNQVVDQFPGTRHSANAAHKLQEWSTGGGSHGATAASSVNPADEAARLAAEEAEFLSRMGKGNSGNQG